MDKQSSVAFLAEILEHLRPYGDVYVERVRLNDTEYLPNSLSVGDMISACMGDDLRLDFSFYNDDGECSNSVRIVPFKTAKHFVTGQGKSFARDMKREVANKLFDLG